MTSTTEKNTLEDLMLAMDVVDTLRHRQQLVDRELNAEARRERLIEKLREIYASQGLEVTDDMLEEGVRALEEERFKYMPPDKSFSHGLARLYIRRERWLKPISLFLGAVIFAWLYNWFAVVNPEKNAIKELPQAFATEVSELSKLSDEPVVLSRVNELNLQGKQAIKNKDFDRAKALLSEMRQIQDQISQAYTLRIVQSPGESSGIWRIPDVNLGTKNYYLIVEAVDSRGNVLNLPVTSEETGKTRSVNRWGVRVDSSLFNRIASDKQDDGIIQNRQIGKKRAGKYEPEYFVQTRDGKITEW